MTDVSAYDTGARPSKKTRVAIVARAVVLMLFVAVAIAVGILVPLPTLAVVQQWAASLGWAGGLLFALVYAAITLTPAPKNLLSIAAGLVFGFGIALALVYAGAMLGAAVAFVLGRALGRDAVERYTGSRVAQLDDLVRRRGFLAIIGVRLIPIIPFTAVNYGAGLTAVRRRDYALGTALGIVPGTAAYVAIGAFGFELSWPVWVAIGAVGALSVGAAIWAERRRRLSREAQKVDAGSSTEGQD